MRDYVIMTDSSCDLPNALARELGLFVVPLTVILDGKTYRNYLDEREITCASFYEMLKEGKQGSTSAVNVEEFSVAMEEVLKAGKDILYLGFSSGLSATYQASTIAAAELRQANPQAKIETVDTLCASLGQGMLVYLAAREKQKGKSLEEVRAFVEETKMHLSHWVCVDDLNHLKRGGRISSAAALLGSTLNIKPIVHVDNEGHLITVGKVRGRKASLKRLSDQLAETGIDLEGQTIFISHAACYDDAELLAQMVQDAAPVKEVIINYIGPVIGAHTGPGTLALFFLAKHR